MKSHANLFLVLLLLVPGRLAVAQDSPGEILAAFDRDDAPGVVLAVFRGGEVVHAEAHGMASLEWGVPLTPETAFNIASVSKQFTAFALALLESRGLLSIDDDIHTVFPELPDFGHPITIRQMLNHTSGLRSLHAIVELAGWRGDDRRTNEDIWRIMLRQKDLNFDPGSRYMYSNTGYMLGAMIVERLTGERFADWMASNVFSPLGMTRTSVQDDYDRVYRNTAASYRPVDSTGFAPENPFWAYYGSGNIHTTVADLARWAHNFSTGELGGPDVIMRMQERGVLTNGDTLRYALGVQVTKIGSLRMVSHGGSIGGYRSTLMIFPEIDAGVVMLGNGSRLPGGVMLPWAAEYLDEVREAVESVEQEEERRGGPPPVVEEPESDVPGRDELATLVGRYYSPELDTAYGVMLDEDGLVLWHMRHGTIELQPGAEGRFESRLATIEFGSRDGRPGLYMSNGRALNVWFERE